MSEIEANEPEQIEHFEDASSEVHVTESDDDAYAWADDPVADEEWTAIYEEEMRQREILEEEMLKRLDGTTQLNDW